MAHSVAARSTANDLGFVGFQASGFGDKGRQEWELGGTQRQGGGGEGQGDSRGAIAPLHLVGGGASITLAAREWVRCLPTTSFSVFWILLRILEVIRLYLVTYSS